MTATIQRDEGGYHVLWYEDDDNDSGYGENARMARWYAHRSQGIKGIQACKRRIEQGPPSEDWFVTL